MQVNDMNFNAIAKLKIPASGGFVSKSDARLVANNALLDDDKHSDKSTLEWAKISSSLVSSSVQNALLRLQETGSVFNDSDAQLMNIRGINNQERERFAQLIKDAAEKGGYNNPVAYIRSLPKEDVLVLMRVHSLAEPNGVTNTDAEGAYNLLLPRSEHVDTNKDGLVNTGAATGFYFPPPNSPQFVKDAWEETVKDMSIKEHMMAQAQFMLASVGANLKLDANGQVIGLYDHTDPEYTNIFPTSETGWEGFLEKLIAQYSQGIKRSPEVSVYLDMLLEFSANTERFET